ncbi:MAG: hypothetical protein RML57_03545 [Acidobacteriota bacterium]|nr:hypothetical protein [Acidobacteriota bacterium]
MRMKTLLKTMNRVTDKRHHRAVAPDREAILDAARRTIANAPPPNASNRAPSRF